MRRGPLLISLLLAAYFVFYAFAWREAPVAEGDARDYMDLARKLSGESWTAPHDRMPGYPLLLAALGIKNGDHTNISNRLLFLFQLSAHAVSAVLLALALHRLMAGRGLVAMFFVLLLLPPFAEAAAMMLTECITGMLLAAMTYSLVRWLDLQTAHQFRRSHVFAWMVGLSGATAFLIRPVYLFLGVSAAVMTLVAASLRKQGAAGGKPEALVTLAAFSIPSFIILVICISLNIIMFNYYGLTPKAGFMLFTRTLPFLERIPDDQAKIRELLIRNRDRSLVRRGSSHTGTQFMWDGGLKDLIGVTGKSEVELSGEMLKMNINLIRTAPLEYASVVVRSVAVSWFPPTTPLAFFGKRAVQLLWVLMHIILMALYFICLSYFVTAAVVDITTGRLLLSGSPSLHPHVFLVECFTHIAIWYTAILSSIVEVGDPRYMRPVWPLVVMAVVLFLARIGHLRTVRKSEKIK